MTLNGKRDDMIENMIDDCRARASDPGYKYMGDIHINSISQEMNERDTENEDN